MEEDYMFPIVNRFLQKYFKEGVQMRRKKTKDVVEKIMPIIEDILSDINEMDNRFGRPNKVKHTGSYYQGLKVKQADEFDFTVPMTSLSELGRLCWSDENYPQMYGFNRAVPHLHNTVAQDLKIVRKRVPLPIPPAGSVRISIRDDEEDEELHRDVMFNHDVIPFLVRRLFKQLVTEAIQNLGMGGQVKVCKLVHGPAITLKIFASVGFEVSVDLAPMCECKLPFTSWIGWPRPNAKWPSRYKIQKIKARGINGVAKKDFYWTLSFAECEKELIYEIDADDGVRKKCLRIMKYVREEFWCPQGVKQVLTSFHLKNILFWECERLPDPADWEEDRLAERFLGMTRRLLDHIRRRHLPMYFYPDVELLKEKDSEAWDKVKHKVEEFLQIFDLTNVYY